LIAVTMIIVLLRELFHWPILESLANILIVSLSVLLIGALSLIIGFFAFLWPIVVAAITNNTLIRERSTQTWGLLLTTPLAWRDIALAKIAAPLRWLAKLFDLIIWFHLALLLVTIAIASSQTDRISNATTSVIGIMTIVLVGAQFAISRVQDYSTACLIGMGSALITANSALSFLLTIIGSVGLVAGRLLISALLLLTIAIPAPQNAILLLLTGPTAGFVLGLQPIVLIVVLICLPVVRELLIRRGYQWVWNHLGEI